MCRTRRGGECGEVPFPNRLAGLGKRRKLPFLGPGGAPAENGFDAFLAWKNTSDGNKFSRQTKKLQGLILTHAPYVRVQCRLTQFHWARGSNVRFSGSFARCRCCDRNFNYPNCFSSRTCGTGRPDVGFCPILVVLFSCDTQNTCRPMQFGVSGPPSDFATGWADTTRAWQRLHEIQYTGCSRKNAPRLCITVLQQPYVTESCESDKLNFEQVIPLFISY